MVNNPIITEKLLKNINNNGLIPYLTPFNLK